uniref:TPT domain-containing protein n=1 Tax=Heterorhabditis bacteriophora TaxID=37862 RepID=A0A1I7W8D4_HETBA
MHAGAREGHLPSFLSCINESSSSPRAALVGQYKEVIFNNQLSILMFQLICTFAISFVNIDTLINYVTFVMWGQRAVTVAALLYLRYRKMPVADDYLHGCHICI